jgi:GrpB-like predicted nucleotidyltransferase (UPF0157 family)
VVPYNPDWPTRFEAERELLERVLAPWLKGGVHHVGSTAIPGIAAKPVIDIVAGVAGLEDARAAIAPLSQEWYVSDPHRPGIAHHFAKPSRRLPEMTHSLHLTEEGSDLWRERLAFRDALRGDGYLAAEYEALKLQLAQEYVEDGAAYVAGKRAFVVRVLASAGLEPGRR